MDETQQDDGPVAVWRMFVAPMTALFRNLDTAEDDLDSLMTSIVNSKRDFSDVLVPNTDSKGDFASQYVAFNGWLLGRLFYIFSVPKFHRIHPKSVKAQLKILNILFSNEAEFYADIIQEYIAIFQCLVKFHNTIGCGGPRQTLQLRPFSASELSILPPEEMDSDPLNFVLTEIEDCKLIMRPIMEILCQQIISTANYQPKNCTSQILTNVLKIMENSDIDLKLSSVNFYLKILDYFGVYFNPTYLRRFLILFCNLILNVHIVNDNSTFSGIDALNDKIFLLFNTLDNNCVIKDIEINKCILDICKIILNVNDEYFPEIQPSNIAFRPDLINMAYELVGKNISHQICGDLEQFDVQYYVTKIPLALKYLILSELNDSIYTNRFDQHLINVKIKSKTYQKVLSCLLKQLHDMCSIGENATKFNSSLIAVVRTFELINHIRIEFYNLYQCKNNLFDFVFQIAHYESNNSIKGNSFNDNMHLNFLSKDDTKNILKYILNIMKHKLIQKAEPQMEIIMCMNIAMFILIMSSEICTVDLLVILQMECFSQSKNEGIIDNIHFPLLSNESHQDLHLHSLNILLTQNLIVNMVFNNDDWNKKKLQLLKSLNVSDLKIYCKILNCLPLLLLNNILTPYKMIIDYLHPVLLSNDKTILEASANILPLVICILSGHYAIVQSEFELFPAFSKFKLTAVNDLNIYLVCLQCCKPMFHLLENKAWKTEKNNKCMILTEKSQLVYTPIHNVLQNLKSLLGNFLDIKYFNSIPKNLVSHVILTFANHSITLSTAVYQTWFKDNIIELSQILQQLIACVMNNDGIEKITKDEIFNSTINILLNATKKSLETNDLKQQDICLEAIHQFGISHPKNVVLSSIKLLIFFVMHPQTPYSPKATFYIRTICESHKTTSNKVYHRYKKDFCRLMMNLTIHNFLIGHAFTTSILKFIRAFGFVGYTDFLSKEFHHSLPYLIPAIANSEILKPIIYEVASLVPCNPSNLIINRFPQIYTYVFLHESEDSAKKCYKYIEDITKTTLIVLIKKYSRVILTELLLQYSCGKEKVIKACKWLASLDDSNSTNSSLSLMQVADFIQPRFLGVLACFDNKLIHSKISSSVKRKALESFPHILYLMGSKHMTPLKFKILATLRTAMSLMDEFPKLNAEAWNAFIRNVDITALGPLLPAIFSSLLPLLSYSPDKVHEIFEYLIISNEDVLSAFIADLFFIQNSRVDDRLKMIVSRHVKKRIPDIFIEKIKWYMKYLCHDTIEIKIHALKYLHELIKDNRSDLDFLIFGSKSVDSSIIELLETLIAGCRDKDVDLATWSGRCIGQLGALQPSMLPQKFIKDCNNAHFTFTIKDPTFAVSALNELIRAFQFEKYTKDMDCYSLAIQEILKTYNISPEGENKALWEFFPDYVQQIMKPLLSSRYTLAYPTNPMKTHPIFGSNQANTFSEWAFNWIGQLIPYTKNDDGIQDFLRMVHPALKKDFRTLILFLPYVILHIILSNNEDITIKNEISAVIGLQSFGNDVNNKYEISNSKVMRNFNLSPAIASLVIEEGTHIKCCKIIYNLLDFLNHWLRKWCYKYKKEPPNDDYKKVDSFLKNFCNLTIAKGNFLCGELERALLYLEAFMEQSSENFQNQLAFLAEIYAILNEPDAVAGIMSMKQSEPSLSELILAHEVTGQLEDAATCYEKYAQQGKIDSERLQGMVEVYLGLDQPFTALQLLQGADDTYPDDEALAAEPFWRLGMFEDLDKLLKKSDISNDDRWGVNIGHCLIAFRGELRNQFREKLEVARLSVLRRLERSISYTSTEESIYSRAYITALELHMITEIEHAEDILYKVKFLNDSNPNCTAIIENLIEDWNLRLKLLQSSVNKVEPILRLRRIILEQSKELLMASHPKTANVLNKYIGKLWLLSAKFARKASIFQQAYIYILNGEKYSPKELFIEKAKLYWMRGQQEPAFCTLKRGIEEHFSETSSLTPIDRKLCAKAKLLIAIYNDETINVDMDVNITHYKEAVEVYRQWEKSLVCLGEYYEKVYAALGSEEKKGNAGASYRAHALDCYGKALQYGHSKLYQSMPRMLSIWLDFEVPTNQQKNNAISTLAQICSIIETFSERLPLYLFLTAFSQIISRICHPIKEVYIQLKSIIIKIILAYPQHALWMMMCVINSSYPQRIKRCQEILNDPRLKDPNMQKLICDFNLFAAKLIELCNKSVPDNIQTTHVSTIVRALPKLLTSDGFNQIMMPHEQFVKIMLPFKTSKVNDHFNYNPFPNLTYITGIEDQVTILSSLQKPRKVTFKGSDGKRYIVMLKSNDDLRKDFRLMEFNAVVNRYLQENPDARQRRLYIRTYTVLPLNEECGLIQWIPNLLGLRPILMDIYKNKGIYITPKELKQMMCSSDDPLSKKRTIFEKQLIPKHPPIFGEWFKYTFSDPHSWYQARSAYIRTTAVMSMVGYILGLGDRHGENILFDSTNGDTVHVDFNCLFNKGEEFKWPERVPFRLTHNMRAAMGPLGHEGMYRKCCEIAIRVLRAQTTTLMSVIRPFVYDPLVSWQRNPGRSEMSVGERTNESARDHLSHIEQRLKGVVRTKGKQFSLSLSPEGQTNKLILEAISVINLCQMYIGWGPFL